VKSALDESEYKLDLVKKENEKLKVRNQELEAEVQKLKKQLPQQKKEKIINDLNQYDSNERIAEVLETSLSDFIVDKKRHSITFEGKEYPFPSDFVINNQASTCLLLTAKNHYENELNKQKELSASSIFNCNTQT
jgi:CYTH domain-containing protein